MVTNAVNDADLRQRAWTIAASVVDPEIPVLTIADLGVLREVSVRDGQVEVAITPTYSGCPAMNVIALEIELALECEGFRKPRIRTVLSPAWTTDWMSEDGRRKLTPRAVRHPGGRLSAMRLGKYRIAVGVRFDLLQGAVALQELPRTF
jgi:ring-1,2-phenylacetyl-CoA epoxidase subunit PaaD